MGECSIMKLGIIEYIDSAHFLPGHETCGNMHGHTYRIEVTIEGEKKENGMIIDFYDAKLIVRSILKEYDHRPLNDLIENPTCENLCESICSKLKDKLDYQFTVRIWEGKNKWVEM